MNAIKRARDLAIRFPWLITITAFASGAAIIFAVDEILRDTVFQKLHPWMYSGFSVVHELGLALIVAAAVSFLYDTFYHRVRFERTVKSTAAQVDKSTAAAVEQVTTATADVKKSVSQSAHQIEAHLQKLDSRLAVLNYVGVLKQGGVIGVWKRYHRDATDPSDKRFDPELQKEIVSAISGASTFLYICGRTLEGSIAHDQRNISRQWMWNAIEQRLKDKTKPRLEVSILLPDIFTLRNTPHEKTANPPRPGFPEPRRVGALQKEYASFIASGAGNIINQTRLVAEFLTNRLVEFVKEHPAEIRFIDRPSPFFSVITEKRAFVENYLPNRLAGEGYVFEYLNLSDVWLHSGIGYYATRGERLTAAERIHGFKSIVRSFVQLRNESSIPASRAVTNFLARKPQMNAGRRFADMKKRFEIGLANTCSLEEAFARHLETAEALAENPPANSPKTPPARIVESPAVPSPKTTDPTSHPHHPAS